MNIAPEVKPDERDLVNYQGFRLECFVDLTTDEMWQPLTPFVSLESRLSVLSCLLTFIFSSPGRVMGSQL